jgi:hypothetical protein
VLRSVARRRLVETENPSACATVNCKLCKCSDSAVWLVIKRDCNRRVNKSRHPCFRHAYPLTRDSIYHMCNIWYVCIIYNMTWDDDCDLHVVKYVNGTHRCLFPEFGWRNWLKWADTLVSIVDLRTKNWTRDVPNTRHPAATIGLVGLYVQ